MTKRFTLIAAALGLVLAVGTVADVSAQPTSPKAQTAAPVHMGSKVAHKSHRLTVAHLRHVRKLHLARHYGVRITRTVASTKTIKAASVPAKHVVRHAMNHRLTGKSTTIVR